MQTKHQRTSFFLSLSVWFCVSLVAFFPLLSLILFCPTLKGPCADPLAEPESSLQILRHENHHRRDRCVSHATRCFSNFIECSVNLAFFARGALPARHSETQVKRCTFPSFWSGENMSLFFQPSICLLSSSVEFPLNQPVVGFYGCVRKTV